MKLNFAPLLAVSLTLAACSDSTPEAFAPAAPSFSSVSVGVARVTNENDAGRGSFRQAVLDANASPAIVRIEFEKRVSTISLLQTVEYTGGQPLDIDANTATLDGSGLPAGASAFVASGGGNLKVSQLSFSKAPGTGMTVAIPATATGTKKVTLTGVTAVENGSHGVLINDQAEYFTDPNSTSTAGSAASLEVAIALSQFLRNGFSDLDRDGLRINEGGTGNLVVTIAGTRVEGNGGDGVEFDERDVGDVRFNVAGSALEGNGSFSSVDYDDGIDIDEGGAGSIIGTFLLTSANRNFEQGFDLNENDAGDLRVDMALVEAIGNHQEGIEYEEDDDFAGGGDIIATLAGIKVRENGADDGDAGLKLREKGIGNLSARLIGIESSNNPIDGVLLREDSDGNLDGTIQRATTNGNTDDGIEFDENGAGNLTGVVSQSTSSNNGSAGIRADQASTGTGTLQFVAVTATGNGAGPVVANGGVTVTQTP